MHSLKLSERKRPVPSSFTQAPHFLARAGSQYPVQDDILGGSDAIPDVFATCGPALDRISRSADHRPQGELASVDTRLAIHTIQALANGTAEEKQKAIGKIKAAPDRYAPPVFYALSNALFADGKKDEGVFWFYAGQLRARFDASRCADATARQAVAVLNQQYGDSINQYGFRNIPMLEALIPKVVEWDRKTAHNYDHRWINLHGMAAVVGSNVAVSLPEDLWEAIAEQTRTEYLAGFQQAMQQLKKQGK